MIATLLGSFYPTKRNKVGAKARTHTHPDRSGREGIQNKPMFFSLLWPSCQTSIQNNHCSFCRLLIQNFLSSLWQTSRSMELQPSHLKLSTDFWVTVSQTGYPHLNHHVSALLQGQKLTGGGFSHSCSTATQCYYSRMALIDKFLPRTLRCHRTKEPCCTNIL